MSICNGCGGVVGRDCFNPQECEWISHDMEMRRQSEIHAQHQHKEDWHRLVISLGCMFDFDATGSLEEVAESARAAVDKRAGASQQAPVSAELEVKRYRWLRFADLDALAAANWGYGEVYTGEQFDAAIDAAMAAKPHQPTPAEASQDKTRQQDSTCSDTLRKQGKPYHRTCMKCGLGPCVVAIVSRETE